MRRAPPLLAGSLAALLLAFAPHGGSAATVELVPAATSAPGRVEFLVLLAGLAPTDRLSVITVDLRIWPEGGWQQAEVSADSSPSSLAFALPVVSACHPPRGAFSARFATLGTAEVFSNLDSDDGTPRRSPI